MEEEKKVEERDEKYIGRHEVKHIEDVLRTEGYHVSTTSGVSMWPMLRDRRDTIILSLPEGRLRKYDIPLYRRGDGYVLHRIIEVKKDHYIICGDNCIRKEYVKDEQIIGVLTGFYRNDRQVNLKSVGYRLYVRIWCGLYPVRVLFKRGRAFLGKIIKLRWSKGRWNKKR